MPGTMGPNGIVGGYQRTGALRDEVDPDGLLTPQQRLFVDALILDPTDRAAAAVAAGAPRSHAAQWGYATLRRPHVAEAVARGMNARADRTKITQDGVLHETFILATSRVDDYEIEDNGDVYVRDGVPDYRMKAISSIKKTTRTITRGRGEDAETEVIREVEVKLWPKPDALKLAGAHVGLFAKKVIVEGNPDKPLENKTTWVFGDKTIEVK